jgi:hypothetical protein
MGGEDSLPCSARAKPDGRARNFQPPSLRMKTS